MTYILEAWTGDQWTTLGIYRRRGTAERMLGRCRTAQELRITDGRHCEALRLMHLRDNWRLTTRSERRDRRRMFGFA